MAVDPQAAQQMRKMWDEWWYDRFELPNDIPPDARRFEVEIDGEVCGGVLLDHVAPRTCAAFAERLPFSGRIIHCAFFGHAAFYLDRVELPELGNELENRSTKLAPGDFIWDPVIQEVTFAYGRHAEMRFPTTIYSADGQPHPNQGCIFARIIDNLDGWATSCKRLRYEGAQVMTTRLIP